VARAARSHPSLRLAAVEKIVAAKGLVSAPELATRKDEWDRAARATPHGQPVLLPKRV